MITELESTKPKPLGLVWVKYPYPTTLSLGLVEALKTEADVHRGQNPPAEGLPSSVIICSNGENVASEVEHLRVLTPGVPHVVFGSRVDPQLARSALKAGACGFIHAGMRPEQIVCALSLASEGGAVFPKEILEDLVKEEPRVDLSTLTQRQLEILELVAEGQTNVHIARRLFLSESTVKQHLSTAYKTLGVKNRGQAARLFRQNNPSREAREVSRGG